MFTFLYFTVQGDPISGRRHQHPHPRK